MRIKANDTFWQRRKLRGHGLQPILMEVLEVEEVIGTRDICKVRWHILGKDSVSTSVFPMMAITEGHFADFVPIPRELFLKAMDILNDPAIDYPKRKRRILYLMRDYHYTDDEPWGLTHLSMGTNVYMRRIPTAEQKEELKRLLKKQYEDAIESIDRDEDLRPAEGDWHLSDEIEKTRKSIYEEVHIGKRSCGWKFLFAPSPEHYEETMESLLQFIHQDGWQLFNEYGDKIDPDKFWDEYVACMEDGWTGETYDRWEREQGHYYRVSVASYEHVTAAGLRFARDADFC